MIDRARAVPAWGWLVAIVLVSFALRAWLARGMVGPFIMVDELIYSELGRSLAAGDGFQVRGAPASGYSLVYPILISPAYALFDALPDAYAAVKTLNALLMSLAAIPAYFLARRVVRPPLALLAAVLAVALPSMAYTGTVMTENAYYPLFLTASLALVLVLERPTAWRVAALYALVGLAFATRVQAVALVPAILVAPFLVALLGRRPLRAELARFRGLYAVVAGAGLLVLVAQLARGRSPSDLLGAYAVVSERSYDAETVARFVLYHLAELDLYLGVLPFAAFLLLVALARRAHADLAPFLAAGIAVSASVLLVVATFASEFADRIQERNVFAVAPFFLIALLAWVERGAPRPPLLAAGVALGAAALPVTIPYDPGFIGSSAISDTLMLLPLWDLYGSHLFGSVDATVLAGGLVAAALLLLVPRRYALALPLATLVFFAAVSQNVWKGEYGFATERVSAGALFNGIRVGHRDWIDRALPDGATAAFVWQGITDRFAVNQNEFFNRQLGPIYYIGGPTPGNLAETEVTVDADTGVITTAAGERVDAEYLIAEDRISPEGVPVARDPGIGLTLWKVDPPLVATATLIEGLHPNDTWSEDEVTWTRKRCRGGTLTVGLTSDPNLYDEVQVVRAYVGGDVVDTARISPAGTAELVVPVEPVADTCRIVFRVAKTRVPGDGDNRRLGAHFHPFAWEPS